MLVGCKGEKKKKRREGEEKEERSGEKEEGRRRRGRGKMWKATGGARGHTRYIQHLPLQI